jgi:hypothetical protein
MRTLAGRPDTGGRGGLSRPPAALRLARAGRHRAGPGGRGGPPRCPRIGGGSAYARCWALNARHGRTYFLATRLLRQALRPAIHALCGSPAPTISWTRRLPCAARADRRPPQRRRHDARRRAARRSPTTLYSPPSCAIAGWFRHRHRARHSRLPRHPSQFHVSTISWPGDTDHDAVDAVCARTRPEPAHRPVSLAPRRRVSTPLSTSSQPISRFLIPRTAERACSDDFST